MRTLPIIGTGLIVLILIVGLLGIWILFEKKDISPNKAEGKSGIHYKNECPLEDSLDDLDQLVNPITEIVDPICDLDHLYNELSLMISDSNNKKDWGYLSAVLSLAHEIYITASKLKSEGYISDNLDIYISKTQKILQTIKSLDK
jgi:hypothetical protein